MDPRERPPVLQAADRGGSLIVATMESNGPRVRAGGLENSERRALDAERWCEGALRAGARFVA